MATLATCTRILEDFTDRDGSSKSWRCGAELKLHITRSPIAQYEWLVVLRCVEHIEDARGVVPESIPVEDDWNGGC
jgi:hypothetical protein